MRATCEIISDIKDGKEVSYEELKMACLVQSFLLFQYRNDVKKLLKGGIDADLVKQAWYSDPQKASVESGISSVYWNGMKGDPVQFLGQAHIPGTPEYEQRNKMSKAVLDKVLKDGEKK
jgi:hypothetical protein